MNRRRKKNKKNNYIIYIAIAIIIFLILIIFGITSNSDKSELQKELKDAGYVTENQDDAFYKNITTNNTITEYYDDIMNKKDSKYEEFSLSKESYDYIMLKMEYENDIITVLNVSSNIKEDYIQFSFELTYNDSHILFDGDNSNHYRCNIIAQKEASDSTVETYCDMVREEVKNYETKKAALLKNPNVQKLLK